MHARGLNVLSTDEAESGVAEVPAASRSIQILDFVSSSPEPPTPVAIARALSLPKSTVHGLCNTLLKRGLVEKRNGGLVIGGHVMLWANAFVARSDMAAEFARLLEEAAELREQSATLMILDGPDVVYIAARHGGRSSGFAYRIGTRIPAPFSAAGKAILSTLPDATVAKLYESFPQPMTAKSVTNTQDLLKELEQVRKRRFSVSFGQMNEHISCVGAP